MNIFPYNTFLLTFSAVCLHYNSLQDNYTALHLAVEAGKPAVVETLLGHGATVHIKGAYRVLIPPIPTKGSFMSKVLTWRLSTF